MYVRRNANTNQNANTMVPVYEQKETGNDISRTYLSSCQES